MPGKEALEAPDFLPSLQLLPILPLLPPGALSFCLLVPPPLTLPFHVHTIPRETSPASVLPAGRMAYFTCGFRPRPQQGFFKAEAFSDACLPVASPPGIHIHQGTRGPR